MLKPKSPSRWDSSNISQIWHILTWNSRSLDIPAPKKYCIPRWNRVSIQWESCFWSELVSRSKLHRMFKTYTRMGQRLRCFHRKHMQCLQPQDGWKQGPPWPFYSVISQFKGGRGNMLTSNFCSRRCFMRCRALPSSWNPRIMADAVLASTGLVYSCTTHTHL